LKKKAARSFLFIKDGYGLTSNLIFLSIYLLINMDEIIPQKYIDDYLAKDVALINKLDRPKLETIINLIEATVRSKKTIYVAGNGGSAATGAHLVEDLQKLNLGKHPQSKKMSRVKVINLTDNIPLLTAWANDEGFQYVFSEPLKNMGDQGDLIILITGSGNSANILEAARVARELKIVSVGLLGFDGGQARELVDEFIIVPDNSYAYVEDLHMIIIHLIANYLSDKLMSERL